MCMLEDKAVDVRLRRIESRISYLEALVGALVVKATPAQAAPTPSEPTMPEGGWTDCNKNHYRLKRDHSLVGNPAIWRQPNKGEFYLKGRTVLQSYVEPGERYDEDKFILEHIPAAPVFGLEAVRKAILHINDATTWTWVPKLVGDAVAALDAMGEDPLLTHMAQTLRLMQGRLACAGFDSPRVADDLAVYDARYKAKS